MKICFYKNIFSFLLVVMLFVLPSCIFNNCPVKEKQKGLVIINVLDKDLYDDCHIAGSINVPFEEVGKYAQSNFDTDAEIVLYCTNYFCTSSGYAQKKLKSLGFKHVWAYEGGTAEWYQLGFPINGPAKQKYLERKIKTPEYDSDELAAIITAETLKRKYDTYKGVAA